MPSERADAAGVAHFFRYLRKSGSSAVPAMRARLSGVYGITYFG